KTHASARVDRVPRKMRLRNTFAELHMFPAPILVGCCRSVEEPGSADSGPLPQWCLDQRLRRGIGDACLVRMLTGDRLPDRYFCLSCLKYGSTKVSIAAA